MNKVMLKKAGIVIFWLIISIVIVLVITILTIYLYPKQVKELQQSNLSSLSYKQSISAIDNDIKNDKRNSDISKNCLPVIKTHDKKTAKAVVMMHGISACPEQFSELADVFFAAGYNVYIPRTPQHGFTDTARHDKVKLTELADFLNKTASQAKNLGNEVGIIGLSGGANLATWLSQRTDIFDRALLLSPFYEPSVSHVPKWKIPLMMTLYGRNILPSSFSGDLSIRTVAKYVMIRNNYAPDSKSSLKHLAVITSEGDDDIDLSLAHSLPRHIKEVNRTTYLETRLSKKFGVTHDIVHPKAPGMKKHKAQLYKLYLDMYENKLTKNKKSND
ncbi:alpha/beta fold hydrolase [Candidatus Saccharibacteria bacterium]|jgi:carboxylesterase|nr:alpha/beta fold hydrolase [Candidatus Saccharibacteria bacterium]